MKIYVASLSDYNAGILHGAWFDLESYEDTDELYQDIYNKLLITSPTAHAEGLKAAEEYAVHDYDGIYPKGLGEYTSLSELMELQEYLNMCSSYEEEEIFCEWLNEISGWTSVSSIDFNSFQSSFRGDYSNSWKPEEDFVYAYAEDIGLFDNVPEDVARYFDYEAYARDLFINDFTITTHGYVFSLI